MKRLLGVLLVGLCFFLNPIGAFAQSVLYQTNDVELYGLDPGTGAFAADVAAIVDLSGTDHSATSLPHRSAANASPLELQNLNLAADDAAAIAGTPKTADLQFYTYSISTGTTTVAGTISGALSSPDAGVNALAFDAKGSHDGVNSAQAGVTHAPEVVTIDLGTAAVTNTNARPNFVDASVFTHVPKPAVTLLGGGLCLVALTAWHRRRRC